MVLFSRMLQRGTKINKYVENKQTKKSDWSYRRRPAVQLMFFLHPKLRNPSTSAAFGGDHLRALHMDKTIAFTKSPQSKTLHSQMGFYSFFQTYPMKALETRGSLLYANVTSQCSLGNALQFPTRWSFFCANASHYIPKDDNIVFVTSSAHFLFSRAEPFLSRVLEEKLNV